MIVGLGMDIIELDRIQDSWDRFGDRFSRRILSEQELDALPENDPVPYLAGRFAAKEAAVKALGTGFSDGISMHHVSVARLESGAPSISFTHQALEAFDALGATSAHVTLSHSRTVASAVVVLEKN